MKHFIIIVLFLLSHLANSQEKINVIVAGGESGSGIATDTTHLSNRIDARVQKAKLGADFTVNNDSLKLQFHVNVLDFGAVGDSVTNNTTAFQNAVNTGYTVYVPFSGTGKYLVSTSVQLRPGQTIFGEGNTTIKITANTRAIVMDSAANVRGLRFQGNGKAGSGEFNTGISLNGSPGASVQDCMFEGFAGDPVNNGGGGIFGSTIYTSASDGVRITNCYFKDNDCGLNLPQRAEYVTVDGNTFGGNTVAILAIAGNTGISDNVIQNNETGIKVLDGTNNAHSIISHNLINHNVYPYWFEDVDFGNGMTVEGNTAFYGAVVFKRVNNLRISGDVWHHMDSIHLDDCSFNSFNGGWLGEAIGTTTPIPVYQYNGAEKFTNFGVMRSDIALPGRFIDMQQDDTVAFKGALIHKNLQAGAGTKAVRYNPTTGIFSQADTATGGGATPGIDDVLAEAQLLTTDRSIDANGNQFNISNASDVNLTSNDAPFDNYSTLSLSNNGVILDLTTVASALKRIEMGAEGLTLTSDSIRLAATLSGTSPGYVWTLINPLTGSGKWDAASGGGANTALSNLSSVAINTSLISDADNTDDLGSTSITWKDVFTRTTKFRSASAGTATLQFLGSGTPSLSLPLTTGTIPHKVVTGEASSATPTPTGDGHYNFYELTALATNATFAAPSGTPPSHALLWIVIKDNGTSRTLAWNAIYDEGTDLPLPLATVAGEGMELQFRWHEGSNAWRFVGMTGGF